MPPETDEALSVVHRFREENVMNVRRVAGVFLVAGSCCLASLQPAAGQCCLDGLFSGCLSGCRKAPTYAVAPVAAPLFPPVAPVAAIPAPPPPVMVPVQQTSYVPETTYRTEYKCVPVTSYKPSCEIDPCTGCQVECMQPVTQYVQQPVSVPVTQYRAVTTTKYVQMQPGYGGATYPAAPAVNMAPPAAMAPAASPFSAVQTTPQAWGAAGADVSRQPLPGVAAPALPPAGFAARSGSGDHAPVGRDRGHVAAAAPTPADPAARPCPGPFAQADPRDATSWAAKRSCRRQRFQRRQWLRRRCHRHALREFDPDQRCRRPCSRRRPAKL